jgi:hypothetical protein
MTRDQIKAIVKARMDEINPLDQGTTILDPQIEANLDFAAVNLLEALPSILAHPVPGSPIPTNLIPNYSVTIPCPSDFLRLHRLRLPNWNRSISELLSDNDPAVDLQFYKHLKATVNKPIGVLVRGAAQYNIICYPPDDIPGTVAEFLYVAKPANAQALNDDLVDLLAWNAAGIIYSIHGQGENANLCTQMLQGLIQAKMKYRS